MLFFFWQSYPNYILQQNMAQLGTIFQFSPSLCPTVTSFNQFVNMPSIFETQWHGRGEQSSNHQNQGQGWEGGQSFM